MCSTVMLLSSRRACEVTREADVAQLQQHNAGVRRAIALLADDEELTLAAMRTCDSLLSTRSSWDRDAPAPGTGATRA